MALSGEQKERIRKSMMNESLRLLGLYEPRLKYLETRNDRLELCRELKRRPMSEREDLVEVYTEHFNNKIQSILFDVENIENKNEEYLKDYLA